MSDFEFSTSEALADWIETSLLVSGSGHFGLDKLFALARSELATSEHKISMALDLMAKRSRALGIAYPFEVNDLAVRRQESSLLHQYATLLLITPGSAARQTIRVRETTTMGEALEELTEIALANFWGVGGEAIRFGHPSKHGRPKEFDQAIPWLARRMGIAVGSGYRPPRRKDGGVDVVAWRHFVDRRPGFPIALAQCTIQGETFTKTSDIDVRLWASWLAMDCDPLSLLVIPSTIRSAGPDWKQLSTVVMVIERLRLMELLARAPIEDGSAPWTLAALEDLRDIMKAAEL